MESSEIIDDEMASMPNSTLTDAPLPYGSSLRLNIDHQKSIPAIAVVTSVSAPTTAPAMASVAISVKQTLTGTAVNSNSTIPKLTTATIPQTLSNSKEGETRSRPISETLSWAQIPLEQVYSTFQRPARQSALSKYKVLGFIASGTYGKVYKAVADKKIELLAIKKFKPERIGEHALYAGLSQSACRETALLRELKNRNVIGLVESILEDRCIYLILEYAEHDLLQMIQFLSRTPPRRFDDRLLKSIIYQMLSGLDFLHKNWVMHRDLKPANILVTSNGVVKIGDLGLARLYHSLPQTLYHGDKIVVTIWYRAPELLLGSKHYNCAIDLWASGCIFGELLQLRPIFKGEEVKADNKIPFQKVQFEKIMEVLGTPNEAVWPGISSLSEYNNIATYETVYWENRLPTWYSSCKGRSQSGRNLLSAMLTYDPCRRITAEDALKHPYFKEDPPADMQNCFAGSQTTFPPRKIRIDDTDIREIKEKNTKSCSNIPEGANAQSPLAMSRNTRKLESYVRNPARKKLKHSS